MFPLHCFVPAKLGHVLSFFLFFLKGTISIYLFIYFVCVGSSFLCEGFLQLRRAGASLHRGARASHCRGLSCCGAQAPDAQAQQLWLTGLVAPRHVGSSQTRAQTRVPCVGRQILNHCATRDAQCMYFLVSKLKASMFTSSIQLSMFTFPEGNKLRTNILFQYDPKWKWYKI